MPDNTDNFTLIPEEESERAKELKRMMEYQEKFLSKLVIPPEYISFVKGGGSLMDAITEGGSLIDSTIEVENFYDQRGQNNEQNRD